MARIFIFLSLFTLYIIYSLTVYSKGTDDTFPGTITNREKIEAGKELYQQYNCTACHQLYGLGGYLGPELTTAYSDPARGELYMKAFLQAGGQRMPNFHFQPAQIDQLLSYLKYVDSTAVNYKRQATP